MIEVELKVPGVFWDKKHRVTAPESCRELTPAQFHTICKLNRGEISADDFLREFFSIPMFVWSKLDRYYIYVLTELVRKVKADSFGGRFFDEFVKIGPICRFLPFMPSMTLMQFMSVDTYANWYLYSRHEEYLANFASVLLLPDDVAFADYDPSPFVLQLRKILKEDASAKATLKNLLFNWQLIKAHLSDKYPNMFPSGGEGEGDARPGDWSAVFDALIGEHLEHIETYKRLPAYDVFRIVDGRIRDNKYKK